ncbi:MAG: nucleoside 2-deoxyribosyltransferase [Verrucomicrobia bacterium]|nr:nucleoside 2-deoxyribosyltransferase [Verrucomicrobiota bacterium]
MKPVSMENDIYLAGPLFTLAERQFNSALAEKLRQLGYTVFLPQEAEPREITSECIFAVDVGGVDGARAVVAIFDGPDPDSGTCWECGYAYGKGKPVIAVRTDFRGIGDGNLAPYNLMLWESSVRHIQKPCLQHDMQSIVDEIDEALQSVLSNKN